MNEEAKFPRLDISRYNQGYWEEKVAPSEGSGKKDVWRHKYMDSYISTQCTGFYTKVTRGKGMFYMYKTQPYFPDMKEQK